MNEYDTIEHDMVHIKDYFKNYKFGMQERLSKLYFLTNINTTKLNDHCDLIKSSKHKLTEIKKKGKEYDEYVKEMSTKIYNINKSIEDTKQDIQEIHDKIQDKKNEYDTLVKKNEINIQYNEVVQQYNETYSKIESVLTRITELKSGLVGGQSMSKGVHEGGHSMSKGVNEGGHSMSKGVHEGGHSGNMVGHEGGHSGNMVGHEGTTIGQQGTTIGQQGTTIRQQRTSIGQQVSITIRQQGTNKGHEGTNKGHTSAYKDMNELLEYRDKLCSRTKRLSIVQYEKYIEDIYYFYTKYKQVLLDIFGIKVDCYTEDTCIHVSVHKNNNKLIVKVKKGSIVDIQGIADECVTEYYKSMNDTRFVIYHFVYQM